MSKSLYNTGNSCNNGGCCISKSLYNTTIDNASLQQTLASFVNNQNNQPGSSNSSGDGSLTIFENVLVNNDLTVNGISYLNRVEANILSIDNNALYLSGNSISSTTNIELRPRNPTECEGYVLVHDNLVVEGCFTQICTTNTYIRDPVPTLNVCSATTVPDNDFSDIGFYFPYISPGPLPYTGSLFNGFMGYDRIRTPQENPRFVFWYDTIQPDPTQQNFIRNGGLPNGVEADTLYTYLIRNPDDPNAPNAINGNFKTDITIMADDNLNLIATDVMNFNSSNEVHNINWTLYNTGASDPTQSGFRVQDNVNSCNYIEMAQTNTPSIFHANAIGQAGLYLSHVDLINLNTCSGNIIFDSGNNIISNSANETQLNSTNQFTITATNPTNGYITMTSNGSQTIGANDVGIYMNSINHDIYQNSVDNVIVASNNIDHMANNQINLTSTNQTTITATDPTNGYITIESNGSQTISGNDVGIYVNSINHDIYENSVDNITNASNSIIEISPTITETATNIFMNASNNITSTAGNQQIMSSVNQTIITATDPTNGYITIESTGSQTIGIDDVGVYIHSINHDIYNDSDDYIVVAATNVNQSAGNTFTSTSVNQMNIFATDPTNGYITMRSQGSQLVGADDAGIWLDAQNHDIVMTSNDNITETTGIISERGDSISEVALNGDITSFSASGNIFLTTPTPTMQIYLNSQSRVHVRPGVEFDGVGSNPGLAFGTEFTTIYYDSVSGHFRLRHPTFDDRPIVVSAAGTLATPSSVAGAIAIYGDSSGWAINASQISALGTFLTGVTNITSPGVLQITAGTNVTISSPLISTDIGNDVAASGLLFGVVPTFFECDTTTVFGVGDNFQVTYLNSNTNTIDLSPPASGATPLYLQYNGIGALTWTSTTSSATLQNTYDNSLDPAVITLSGGVTPKSILIDDSTPYGNAANGILFGVGSTTTGNYFRVNKTGASTINIDFGTNATPVQSTFEGLVTIASTDLIISTGNLQISNAANGVFIGANQIIGAQEPAIPLLIDNTTGTPSLTLVQSTTFTDVDDNMASIAAKINIMIQTMQNHGLIA